jgi:hypothetical protein
VVDQLHHIITVPFAEAVNLLIQMVAPPLYEGFHLHVEGLIISICEAVFLGQQTLDKHMVGLVNYEAIFVGDRLF